MEHKAHATHGYAHHQVDQDLDLVEMWLRKDRTRWVAGVLAGALAAVVMMLVSMILSAALGNEFWFPVKVAALPFMGNTATAFGMHLGAILLGMAVYVTIGAFFGAIFSHFVFTNSMPALFGMGLTWGIFSWIFINNLFIPAFSDIIAAQLSAARAFPANLAFGVSLVSVAFFDRMLRGNR